MDQISHENVGGHATIFEPCCKDDVPCCVGHGGLHNPWEYTNRMASKHMFASVFARS